MPCNTIRLATINLGKADPGHLKLALEALGFRVETRGAVLVFADTYNRQGTVNADGKVIYNSAMLTSKNLAITENMVKQAYSAQVVQATAKKFGWNVREKGENQYTMVRR